MHLIVFYYNIFKIKSVKMFCFFVIISMIWDDFVRDFNYNKSMVKTLTLCSIQFEQNS